MTISKVRRQLNRRLMIKGILLTMVDKRTNNAKEIISLIHETYGEHINIFGETFPFSVRRDRISSPRIAALMFFTSSLYSIRQRQLIRFQAYTNWQARSPVALKAR